MDATLWIAVALAIFLGFVLGVLATSLQFVRLDRARRASIGAAAGIARVGLEALPTRSAADILNGRITIILGSIPYNIGVLPRRASREWTERLDSRWAVVTNALTEAGDDTPEILQLLSGHTDFMIEMLRAYDVEHILPDDEFIETFATDGEIIAALVEVWRAVNPLAAIGAEAAAETMAGTQSAPLNSLPDNTDGVLSTSTIG